jgi:hypothetical protein
MKKLSSKLLAVAVLSAGIATSAQAGYVFVGSWHVGDGPDWTTNPAVLNGQEAAALLFGGVAADYAISTISSNVADINFMSFLDGWGDDQYLTSPKSQDYKLDSGGPGYNEPFGGPSYSAFVLDHSCFNRYSNPNERCAASEPGLNFAFRIDANGVPEPSSIALAGLALLGAAFANRSKSSRKG